MFEICLNAWLLYFLLVVICWRSPLYTDDTSNSLLKGDRLKLKLCFAVRTSHWTCRIASLSSSMTWSQTVETLMSSCSSFLNIRVCNSTNLQIVRFVIEISYDLWTLRYTITHHMSDFHVYVWQVFRLSDYTTSWSDAFKYHLKLWVCSLTSNFLFSASLL